MTFGLIGYPLTHSFSQPYFTEKFAQLGLAESHLYRNFELADISDFPAILKAHPDLRGLNVTIPHKTAVIPYLDYLDPDAAAIGAVNTILVDERGETTGFNTDVIGFKMDLVDFIDATLRPHRGSASTSRPAVDSEPGFYAVPNTPNGTDSAPWIGWKALVLGTGGAAQAIHHVLEGMGIGAQAVSRHSGPNQLTYAEVSPAILADHRLVINTTPLGMYPKINTYPELPYAYFAATHFCYDLVYNPAQTSFLRQAAARGAKTRSGLGMLHGQAEAAWAIWTR
ncbi:MAG: shikimate dehydrogenase [Bacteroidota bacterium]